MNKTELKEIERYLGANLISTYFEAPENISYEEVMVWSDLSYEDKWNNVPKGLVFTGGSLTDVKLEDIFKFRIYYKYLKFDEKFIRDNFNSIFTADLLLYQGVSEELILEYIEIDNFRTYISLYQKLSEEFIRKFEDKLDWNELSRHQNLSENFIREFKDKVNWSFISTYQRLSEEFIIEFADDINWYCIAAHQVLSEDFVRKHIDKLDWLLTTTCQELCEESLEKIANKK